MYDDVVLDNGVPEGSQFESSVMRIPAPEDYADMDENSVDLQALFRMHHVPRAACRDIIRFLNDHIMPDTLSKLVYNFYSIFY